MKGYCSYGDIDKGFAVRNPRGHGNQSYMRIRACTSGGRHVRGVMLGPERSCGIDVHATKNPFGRNIMSCELFAQLVKNASSRMVVVRQERPVWGPPRWCSTCSSKFTITDCLTLLRQT